MPDDSTPAGPAPDEMAEDDATGATDRLEQALERIAAAAHSARPSGANQPGGAPASAEVARRLDAVIANLRAALGTA